MTEVCVRRKSSAVSVWIFPSLAGRDSVAILPSGFPVENVKEAAAAEDPAPGKAPSVAAKASKTAFVLSRLKLVFTDIVSLVGFVVLFFITLFSLFCLIVE